MREFAVVVGIGIGVTMLYIAARFVPCITGQLDAAGQLVCPETAYVQAVGIVVLIVIVIGFNAIENAYASRARSESAAAAPQIIDVQARHGGQDITVIAAQVAKLLADARLAQAKADDITGVSQWPALPQTTAPPQVVATAGQNGHGNGSNGHRVYKAEDWK